MTRALITSLPQMFFDSGHPVVMSILKGKAVISHTIQRLSVVRKLLCEQPRVISGQLRG